MTQDLQTGAANSSASSDSAPITQSPDQPETESEPQSEVPVVDLSYPELLKSRIRELFFLEGQTSKEIKGTINEEDKQRSNPLGEDAVDQLVDQTLRDAYVAGNPDGNGNRYVALPTGLYKVTLGPEAKSVALTNFVVTALTAIIHDDGVNQEESIRVEVRLRKRTDKLELSLEEFRQMNWHLALFQQRCTITPKMKEHALFAIQKTAQRRTPEVIYTATGWMVIQGKMYFLHADGAIAADGQHREIRATLKENLRLYSLPDPPTGERLQNAIRTSMKLLEAGDHSVTVPLFGAVYRAPLGNADFVGHSSGKTGSLKTAAAIVAQKHYGKDFNDQRPPASWSSTGNFNQARLHAAKDVFSLLDDFVPRGTPQDRKRQHADFDRMVRAIADGAFRGRLDAKHSDDAPSRGPRGLVWSTGEVVPEGESCQSRLINTPYRGQDGLPLSIDSEELRELHNAGDEGILAGATSGFIQYLIIRYKTPSELFAAVRQRVVELSNFARKQTMGQHLRTPENLANIAVGIEMFLRFAKNKGAIDEKECRAVWEQSWKVLINLSEIQTQRQQEEDPVRETHRLLQSADEAGQLSFRKPDEDGDAAFTLGGRGPDAKRGDSDNFIGWRESESSAWWLEPNRLWTILQRLFRDQGRSVPKDKVDLFTDMENNAFITKRDEKGRSGVPTVKRLINGKRVRVIEILPEHFAKAEQLGDVDASSDPSSDRTHQTQLGVPEPVL